MFSCVIRGQRYELEPLDNSHYKRKHFRTKVWGQTCDSGDWITDYK